MKFWNNPELQQFFSEPRISSRDEEVEWIRSTWERRRNGDAYIFGIFLHEQNQYVGNVELRIANTIVQRGTLGIVIFNPNYWNKGIGTEAVTLILNFGFSSLNLRTVELEVFDFNRRAQQCYRKIGFVEVGRKRQAHFSNGQFNDIILMDISSTEFRSRVEKRE